MMSRKGNSMDNEEGLIEAFSRFDKNDNGKISCDELRFVMMNLGVDITKEEIEDLVSLADMDGDGTIGRSQKRFN